MDNNILELLSSYRLEFESCNYWKQLNIQKQKADCFI